MFVSVAYGPYWAHVSQAWAQRNHPNMHITFYEKLKRNPKVEFERLNKFLDTKLTPEQIDKVGYVDLLSHTVIIMRRKYCYSWNENIWWIFLIFININRLSNITTQLLYYLLFQILCSTTVSL